MICSSTYLSTEMQSKFNIDAAVVKIIVVNLQKNITFQFSQKCSFFEMGICSDSNLPALVLHDPISCLFAALV